MFTLFKPQSYYSLDELTLHGLVGTCPLCGGEMWVTVHLCPSWSALQCKLEACRVVHRWTRDVPGAGRHCLECVEALNRAGALNPANHPKADPDPRDAEIAELRQRLELVTRRAEDLDVRLYRMQSGLRRR